MQSSMQNDSMDYNNPELEYDNPELDVTYDIQEIHGFENGFDNGFENGFDDSFNEMTQFDSNQLEVNQLDVNQQIVDINQDALEPVFEGQEVPLINSNQDSGSSRGFGLRSKILLLMFLLVISSLGASLFGTLNRVRTAHFENLYTNRLLAAEALQQKVVGYFNESISQLLTSSSTQVIQSSVEQRNASYIEKYGDDYNLFLEEINTREEQWSNADLADPLVNSIVTNDLDVNAASYHLREFASSYGEHTEILITDQHGATVAASHKMSDYYHADQEWWQGAWANGQGEVYLSEIPSHENIQTEGFIVALPLFSDAGNLLGVMRSKLNITQLADYVLEPKFDETGHAVVLGSNGLVTIDAGQTFGHDTTGIPLTSRQQLIASDREGIELTDETGERSMFVSLNLSANTDFNDDRVEIISASGLRQYDAISNAMTYLRTESLSQAVNDLGWTIVIRQKYDDATQVVRNANRWSILIFGITLLATLFFGTIFARRLTKPLNHLVEVMQKVGSGDLSTLAKVNTKDEIGLLANSVNDTVVKLRDVVQTERERDVAQQESEMLQGSISGFLDVITDVAQGDLTRRGTVSADILGNVVDATNVMVEEVGFLLNNVKQTATQVGHGAQNMILSSESISESNQSRVQTANQLAEAVQSVSQSMQQMAGQVDTAAATALQTYSASQEGSLVVKDTLVGMQNIRQEVQTIAKRIKNLGDRSLEISEIVETIRHLASQTNLLALNAAIEAAGAGGEAGGRFAIVADEVRKLAENSAQATERVSSLIQSVQEEVQDVVISVEDGIREVEGGYELATQAGQRLDAIGQQAQSSAGLTQQIAGIVREQVERVAVVNSNLQMMSNTGVQSQQVVAEGKQIAEQLQNLSQELLESLSHFRLEEAQLVD